MRAIKNIASYLLALGLAVSGSGWAVVPTNTLTANVADYNAAQVAAASGVVAVPTGLVTYTSNISALTIGTSLTITLPPNFLFASDPTLTAGSGATSTFSLSAGGIGNNSATFTIATADLAAGGTVSLDAFSVTGAIALETLVPVASALPVTAQAAGIDTSPLSVGAFASEPGAQSVFVGAIQFIDTASPSLGKLYYGPPDALTIVLSAIAITPQAADAATQAVPVLSPNGLSNKLLNSDTATVALTGNWVGVSFPFSSSTSDCAKPIVNGTGTATATTLTLPNVPINVEVFFCITATGTTVLQANPNGITSVTVTPGVSTDFVRSTPTNNEFPGLIQFVGPPLAPTLAKAFGDASISYGSTTSLSFTVGNLNSDNSSGPSFGGGVPVTLTGLAFTDTLPAGMVVATPNGLAGTCGGGTITATAGSGSVSLAGASVDGGTQCTFSVNVLANAVGSFVNTTGAISSTEAGAGNTATASLTITQATNVITFAAPASPVIFGVAPITLTASASSGLPVTFTASGPATVSGNTLTITGAGTVTVTASQAGNADYVAAAPVPHTIAVSTTTSSITLISSATTTTAGQAVTLTASVTGGSTPTGVGGTVAASKGGSKSAAGLTGHISGAISAVPTGTITFTDNGTTIASITLDTSGNASFSTSALTVGSHTIVASYSGDANTAAGTASLTIQVNAAVAPTPPAPAPATSVEALGLLASLLALVGVLASVNRKPKRQS